jgi:hypothetical protein
MSIWNIQRMYKSALINLNHFSQFTFREEWWDARLAYERFGDENTHIPPFVVLATSDSADLSRQVWMPDT